MCVVGNEHSYIKDSDASGTKPLLGQCFYSGVTSAQDCSTTAAPYWDTCSCIRLYSRTLPQYSAVSNKPGSSIQMDKLEMLSFQVTGAIGASTTHPTLDFLCVPVHLFFLHWFVIPAWFLEPSVAECDRQTFLLEVSLLLKSAACAVQLILRMQQASACFSKPRIHLAATAPYVCAISHIPDDKSLKILPVMGFIYLLELGAHLLFFLSKMRFTRPRLCSLSPQPDVTDDR